MRAKRIRSILRGGLRWSKRLLLSLVLFAFGYAAMVWILGRIPINRDFQNAVGENTVEILLINNGVHVDLVLPLDHPNHSLRSVLKSEDFAVASEVYSLGVFGWGNRKFYLETPTWDKLRVSTVAYAFSGVGDTCVRVNLTTDSAWPRDRSRMLRLTDEQFGSLVQHVVSTMELDSEGKALAIEGAHYRSTDAFYRGLGSYHLFRTCNVWVGEGLRKAGVRVGVWTVTPQSLFASLPKDCRLETSLGSSNETVP